MNTQAPLITVLLPVYNAAAYLREAIDSVLSQSFTDFELLLIDDGSTDESVAIIRSYSDPRIRLVTNERNLKLIATLNKGIELACGQYIARMDADDICHPDRLRLQLALINKYPDAALVASPIELMNADGLNYGYWQDDFDNRSPDQIRTTLAKTNCVAHPSILIKKKILEKYKYLADQKEGEDWDLWMRIVSDGGRIYKTQEVLLRYRIHPDSMTHLINKNTRPEKKSNQIRKLFLFRQIKRFRMGSFELRVLYALLRGMTRDWEKNRVPQIIKTAKALVSISPFSAYAQYGQLKTVLEQNPGNSGLFFFFPYLQMGGAEKVHTAIVQALSDQKPWVFIGGFSQGRFYEQDFQSHSRLFDIPHAANHPFYASRTRKLLAGFIEKQASPRVFGCLNFLFYDLSQMLSRHVRCFDLKHDFRLDLNTEIERKLLPVYLRMDRRIFISQRAIEETKSYYALNHAPLAYNERLRLILNSVDVPLSRPPKSNTAPLKVLYAGRGTSEKRAYLVCRLAEAAIKEKLSLQFTIAGDVSAAVNAGDYPFVEFLGEIKEEKKMQAVYAASDVVLITSEREGFPMAILEGMANGAVPLSTPVGDVPRHMENGKNGYVTSSLEEEVVIREMLGKLKEWVGDRKVLEVLSTNAFEYASMHFRKERFEQEYRELLRKQSGPL